MTSLKCNSKLTKSEKKLLFCFGMKTSQAILKIAIQLRKKILFYGTARQTWSFTAEGRRISMAGLYILYGKYLWSTHHLVLHQKMSAPQYFLMENTQRVWLFHSHFYRAPVQNSIAPGGSIRIKYSFEPDGS